MNPFVELGLSMDADEAQIRRAYAQRLRTTRPDDDAAGFQRLNEVYQRCLARARRRASETIAAGLDPHDQAGDPDGNPSKAPDFDHEPRIIVPSAAPPRPIAIPSAPEPFAVPTAAAGASAHTATRPVARSPHPHAASATPIHEVEPEFDLSQFLDELSYIAQTSTTQALQHWLDQHPALYVLAHQHAVARALIAYLSDAPSLYIAQLDTLLRFFSLDTVRPGSSSTQMRVDGLRERAKARGGDFREVSFQRNPRPGKRGKHPVSLPWGSIAGLLALLAVSTAKVFYMAYG